MGLLVVIYDMESVDLALKPTVNALSISVLFYYKDIEELFKMIYCIKFRVVGTLQNF